MKHVPRQWLRRLQIALLLVDAVVIGLYLYGFLTGAELLVPGSIPHEVHDQAVGTIHQATSLGITPLIAGFAAFHAIYTASIVWWLDKSRTWLAHAIGILATGGMFVALANSDSSLHLLYHLLLMAFMFVVPMAGTLVTVVLLASTYVMLITSSLSPGHLLEDPSGHVIEMILVSLSSATACAGWYLFNKRYVQNADTTVVKSLTNLVRQERSTVSLILESITDGVMIINTDGIVQILNDSSTKMLGWTKDEAKNLQYKSLITPAASAEMAPNAEAQPDNVELPIAETFKTSQAAQGVLLIKTRDGRQIYMDITASPILQEENNTKKMVGVIAVLRDVDKQKREEKQRSEFISTASHEMRTPVAAIEGYLALAMNEKVSRIDNKARGFLEKAHSSTQHLGKLFQDLLTSAKAEDGRLVSHPVVLEMGEYLQQLTDTLRFAAEKKSLLVDFTIGASAPDDPNSVMNGKIIKPLYYVHVDPDRIREVITNLFDNAVKYTESGKISIGLTGNTDVVQFYIRDTGPGVPPEDLPHLFQKFYRVDNSATRTIGGTGLGLFICRKIVELYKGRIWAESEQGKGSTFYINLPRLSTQKATELQAEETAKAANASPLSN